MKAGKAVGAIVPWILIIVGLAVMYQVAQRSGLVDAAGGLAGAVSGGGGRSARPAGAAAGTGSLGEVLGAVVSGPNSGESTGGGKGITGVNASPVVNAVPVSSAGPSWGQSGYDYAPSEGQKVTVPASVVSGPATGMPVGAMVIEHTDARVNKGLPQLISLANGMSASEFGRRLAQ